MDRTRLPHLLSPESYFSPEYYERELHAIFRRQWHAVGTIDDIPKHGNFLTTEILGTPVIVRNHDGEVRAFLNVCAHRHTLLTHLRRGSATRLRCQYHGWEYDGAGAVCKIPDAACFVPIRKGDERLLRYRAEMLGKVIFVALSNDAPQLQEMIGERTWAFASEACSTRMRQAYEATIDHPCNWKIPLENVLESYHVPSLHNNFIARHPRLFKLFQGDSPEASRATNELGDRFTIVRDALGADSRLYRALVRRFRPDADLAFEHLHLFPNVLFGRTSIVGFFQQVHPISATRSRSIVRIFLDLGQSDAGLFERSIGPLADRLSAELFKGLMREDAPIFPDVQRGMEASLQAGVLGSREARIHHFHAYVMAQVRSI